VADLIAQGREPQQRWRRALPEGRWEVLGRAAGTWAVPWDEQVSRRHAEFCWHNNHLDVRRLPTARNAIYLRGQEAVRLSLRPGEHFVVGSTTFTLVNDAVTITEATPGPVEEHAYSPGELRGLRYRNADDRLEVLSRLPDVISGAANDAELFVRLVNLLLAGIPRAETVALVAADVSGGEEPRVRVLHWDRRRGTGGDFHPSARLVGEARRRGQSVLHIWDAAASAPAAYTVCAGLDWAFCTPVREDATEGWAIYVAGRSQGEVVGRPTASDPKDLRDDLKFTEMVAAILGSLRQVRRLQHAQAVLGQFFSPVVLSSLIDADPDRVLAPRETEVSVLFCDLRGFSRESEKHSGDLLGLLERVSRALRVMTQNILDEGGVVGDFQGDAAMGFWGWPLCQPDTVARTCRTALAIREQFEAKARQPDHALADFRVGIGLATGPAVAGRIGTLDQAKVSVFGPVVNLASRLEGMTKILGPSILLDEPTARAARATLGPDQARFRRVARVRPYGLDTPLTVTELLPPACDSELTDVDLATYESAFDAFQQGRWTKAAGLLNRLPESDAARGFLLGVIAQHECDPPPGWEGVIALTSKT
jgi:adenylate cyclase